MLTLRLATLPETDRGGENVWKTREKRSCFPLVVCRRVGDTMSELTHLLFGTKRSNSHPDGG